MTRNKSRRSILAGAGVGIAGLVGAGFQVAADGHDTPVVIESVTPEHDLIVLRNEGDSDVDLSNYVIDWIYNHPGANQEDSLPEGSVIAAGDELHITSGYYDTDADVTYDYDNGRIDNDNTNIIALLTPDQGSEVSVYDTSTGEDQPEDTVGDGPEEEYEDELSEEDELEEEESSEDEAENEEEPDETAEKVEDEVEEESETEESEDGSTETEDTAEVADEHEPEDTEPETEEDDC